MYRPDADAQEIGDFLVQRPATEVSHHLVLPWCQVRERLLHPIRRQSVDLVLEVSPHQPVDGRRIEPWPSIGIRHRFILQQVKQLPRRCPIQKVAV